MVGSEGTLAIITKAILKIRPMPEELGRIMAYFTDIENVGRSIMHLKSSGFIPYIAEFLDKGSLESVKIAKGIDYPKESNYLLMVDMASTHESISRLMEETSSVIKRFNPVSISITTDRAEMEKMYEARKGLYSSSLLLRESRDQYIVIADIVVPLSELSSAMREMRDIIDRSGIKAILFGHIGDGNIHGNIFASPGSEEDRKKVEKLQLDLGMVAIRHNGSVSAEHGIGVEKKELLREEMKFHNSEYTLDIMKRIKEVFDPKGLLNRGKIFD
jgi:glycolate oxidase